MKLLIITQKVDEHDEVLGFMHGWIEEFAKQCDALTIICLEKGSHRLPANVRVWSLGKEKPRSRAQYVFLFYLFIWRERKNYDAVFVHMNPIYILLGGLLWRILGKKVSLWYAHGKTSWSLWVAEKIAHIVFTSTASGFRLPSKTVNIVGQGIDTDRFVFAEQSRSAVWRIITIGRMAPVKNYETLIDAIKLLVDAGTSCTTIMIGGVVMRGDGEYQSSLVEMVQEKNLQDHIHFVGAIPHSGILPYLNENDIFVNTSLTGSLDKAGLEAMAVGLPVLACNEAYQEVLAEYQNTLLFEQKNPADLAKKLEFLMQLDSVKFRKIRKEMRNIVVERHSLPLFVEKIITTLERKNS